MERVLDPYRQQILDYLKMGTNLAVIAKIINPKFTESITFNSYRYFVQHEVELLEVWKA
jgi:hypothetical protein